MRRLTILVVDDDRDMRLYMRSCLCSAAIGIERVIEATDGLEALPLVRSGAVHLVVTDAAMPRLDGYALRRLIRDDPRLTAVPVLIVSGEGSAPHEDLTADGFLAKPFNAKQLVSAVLGLIERRARPPPRPDG